MGRPDMLKGLPEIFEKYVYELCSFAISVNLKI